MICKNCGAKADDQERFCPTCGEELNPRQPEDRVGVQDAGAEGLSAGPQADNTEREAPGPGREGDNKAAPKKSRAPVLVVVLLLIVVTAGGLVVSGVIPLGGSGGKKVVATMKGKQLTQQMLGYYYWDGAGSYAQYGYIDLETPLSEQAYTYEAYESWHDYMVDMSVDSWANYTVMYDIARAEGHEMDTAYTEYLAGLRETLDEEAGNEGLDSADALLAREYGEFADFDSYYRYMEVYCLVSSYVEAAYEGFLEEGYTGLEMTDSVNIRHILFMTGTEDDEAVKTTADAVYADWQADGSEDYFADLALEHTDDGNGFDGGLYEGVYPGQMVPEFNDWCFDPARQVGDSGMVQTEYGYHIMYFSGYGEAVPADANAAMAAEEEANTLYNNWLEGLLGEGDYVVYYDKITQW